MHDVDVHLILIVHLIQNQLVFIKKLGPLWFIGFPKRGNRENMGLEWNVLLNPIWLENCVNYGSYSAYYHTKSEGTIESGLSGWKISSKSNAKESSIKKKDAYLKFLQYLLLHTHSYFFFISLLILSSVACAKSSIYGNASSISACTISLKITIEAPW